MSALSSSAHAVSVEIAFHSGVDQVALVLPKFLSSVDSLYCKMVKVAFAGRRNRQGRRRDLVLHLGAEQYLDLAHDALDEVKGVDVVFDLIGGDVLHRSWPMLRPGGSIVSIVEAPNAERADVNSLLFVVEPNGEQLTELARRIDTERLRPVVGNVGALSDGPRLWAKKVAGGVPGKSCSPHRALPWGEVIGCEMAATRPTTGGRVLRATRERIVVERVLVRVELPPAEHCAEQS